MSNLSLKEISDEAWFEAILKSVSGPVEINGIMLPGFPDERLRGWVVANGTSEGMLRLAFKMYNHVKTLSKKYDVPFDHTTKILDFGVGWGRIARFFLREIAINNLYGVDVLKPLTDACKKDFGTENFSSIEQNGGRLNFENDEFDIIFANSVFSHLTEALNKSWYEEIARVLKPGGIACLTIIDKNKFDIMVEGNSAYYQGFNIDSEDMKKAFAKGKLKWFTTKRVGQLEGYGLTFVPQKWIKKNWTSLSLREFVEDYSQTIVVLTKDK